MGEGFSLNIAYYTIVWGSQYIAFLMDYAIPSMMSEKNIECVDKSFLYILTDKPGEEEIIKHENYEKVSKCFNVKFLSFRGNSIKEIHRDCVNEALKICREDKVDVVRGFAPDVVISDGFLKNTLKRIKEGYKATVIPIGAMRVNDAIFKSRIVPESLSSPQLVDLFLKNMHDETRGHFFDNEFYTVNPVQVIYQSKVGLQVHSFYHQPGYITVGEKDWSSQNIEFDLINNLMNVDEVYFMNDSDEGFEVSLKDDRIHPALEYSKDSKHFISRLMDIMVGYQMNPVALKSFSNGYLIK